MVHMLGFAHLQRATASCVSPKSSVFKYVPNPAFTFHPPVLFSFRAYSVLRNETKRNI